MFGTYSYLLSIVLFAGIPVAIEWVVGFSILRPYIKKIFLIVGIGLIVTLGEAVALNWRAWEYSPTKSFNTKVLGVEVETYIASLFISFAVSAAVILGTYYQDHNESIFLKFREKCRKIFFKSRI